MLCPYNETTLVLIKPDAVKQDLMIDIIEILTGQRDLFVYDIYEDTPSINKIDAHLAWRGNNFEHTALQTLKKCKKHGIDIRATKMSGRSITEIADIIKSHYIKYLLSGPLYAVSISGYKAISKIKKLCGSTFPAEASSQSIRGKFGSDNFEICIKENRAAHNLVHAAESRREAFHQYQVWFPRSQPASIPQP